MTQKVLLKMLVEQADHSPGVAERLTPLTSRKVGAAGRLQRHFLMTGGGWVGGWRAILALQDTGTRQAVQATTARSTQRLRSSDRCSMAYSCPGRYMCAAHCEQAQEHERPAAAKADGQDEDK